MKKYTRAELTKAPVNAEPTTMANSVGEVIPGMGKIVVLNTQPSRRTRRAGKR